MQNTNFWDVTQNFTIFWRNIFSGYLLGIFFHPDDEDSTFVHNVDKLPYMHGFTSQNIVLFGAQSVEGQSETFQILTAVTTKISVFCDVAPCGLLQVYRRFGGTYLLLLVC
jgi:hypothetical protein